MEDIQSWVENTDFKLIAGLPYWASDHFWKEEHHPVLKSMANKLVDLDLTIDANLNSFYDGSGDAYGAFCKEDGYIHKMLDPNFYKEIIPIGNKLISQAGIILRSLSTGEDEINDRLNDFNDLLSVLSQEGYQFEWPSF